MMKNIFMRPVEQAARKVRRGGKADNYLDCSRKEDYDVWGMLTGIKIMNNQIHRW